MNKMASMPIYDKKTLSNLLLQNLQADFIESCHLAFGTPAHLSLHK